MVAIDVANQPFQTLEGPAFMVSNGYPFAPTLSIRLIQNGTRQICCHMADGYTLVAIWSYGVVIGQNGGKTNGACLDWCSGVHQAHSPVVIVATPRG
ncbi:hypothetical protein O9992_20725 [Vibrio lentus]|nr:hypothetical protein [Vibrio lentus]